MYQIVWHWTRWRLFEKRVALNLIFLCLLWKKYIIYNLFYEPRSLWGVLDTTLCDKVCQWLSSDIPVSSINKTDRNDIAEILLKVALNTITLTPMQIYSMILKGCIENTSQWTGFIKQIVIISSFDLFSNWFLYHTKEWDSFKYTSCWLIATI
jgi:hypothetical protein